MAEKFFIPANNGKIDFAFITAIQKECIQSVILWQEKQKVAYEKVVEKV